uniref:Peptidase_M13 domain-containing protein n=1 Tax=Parastrongyloides trichosuri TaxID=131310 RepID=A0A0N4ZE89_PARTI
MNILIICFFIIYIFFTNGTHNSKNEKALLYNESFTLKSLNDHINWKEDSCNDFHEFVCGTFLKNNHDEDNDIFFTPDTYYNKSDFERDINDKKIKIKSKALDKIKKIKSYFENYNNISLEDKINLERLFQYPIHSLFLSYIAKTNNYINGLKLINEIFDDLKNEMALLINEKEWLDKKIKKRFLKKLSLIQLDMKKNDAVANRNYLEYCIDALNFNYSDSFDQTLYNMRYYFYDLSKRLNLYGITCNEIIMVLVSNYQLKPNAAYILNKNTFEFTYPLLMYPYFDNQFPTSLNYGMIASLIGHEILHAFDKEGRTFDRYGNQMKSLSTNHSEEEFNKRERCFIDQYNNQIFYGTNMKVNGTQTLVENICDNGGIKLAYRTYLKYSKKQNIDNEKINGNKTISSTQLFFVSVAKQYCMKREYLSKMRAQAFHFHAGFKNRITTMLSNYNEFSKAFNCPVGTPMNPIKKCELW